MSSDSKLGSRTNITPHTVAAKLAHWGFLAVFVYALTKQLDEVEELADPELLQSEMVFASIFLMLLLGRFVFMQFTRPTVLPPTPRKERLLARAVHIAMYLGLGTIAVTGLAIGSLYESGQKDSQVMAITLILHEIAINLSYLLIIGHIAAAVYHRRKSDGVWNAMVPVWKEPN